MIKIHGVILSPFVRKALLTLEYKEVEYENEPVFPGSDEPAFRAISPLGKIPVLEHDGYTIPDTSVICRYLDRLFPERSIYPDDPKDEANALWIEEFADTRLMDACAGLFVQRFLNPTLRGQDTDETVVANILDNLMPAALDYVESITPEEGLLVGESVTIADISVVTCFIQGQYGDFEVDGSEYPKIRRYLDFTLNTDVVKNRLVEEKKFMSQITGA
ncbi:MAG: glutathione S-transferase family protein [Gammaproteobacteria bacterium]|nr:glutathione S-transferase family protein [Gammaproteobacteria bacterium]